MQQKKAHSVVTAVMVALLGLLVGCGIGSDDASHPLTFYLARLERTLDLAFPDTASSALPLPRSRALSLALASSSIDMLDMLALRNCALETTLGKSNSSLGKVATASQRLLLELTILAQLPDCIASLDADDEASLLVALRTAQEDKLEQLPARIWNATLAGPEFRRFWQSSGALGQYPDNTGSEVPAALARLAQLSQRWLSGDYMLGHEELETLLDQVRRGDGGSLIYALAQQQSSLQAAAPGLQQRLTDPPLCFGKTPSPEGRILETVVRKFFAGELQPWSVRLDRRRQQLMPPVLALEEQLAMAVPPEYAEWQTERDSLLASSINAPKAHALLLAELLDSCGLRPGSGPANSS